jgi:mRNA interferase RelE/StbE
VAAHRVEVATRARRDLERLAPALVERLGHALMALGDDPRPRSCEKLIGVDAYRIRVGGYRIIYEIDDRARIVIVSRIRHRHEVYRKLR